MKISFLIPPPLSDKPPAERVFGCNYGLYPIPNIFILYVASLLEKNGYTVRYVDAAIEKWSKDKFEDFLRKDDSDVYSFYTVFLSEETDKIAHRIVREIKGDIPIIFFGPQPTYKPEKYLIDENTYIVRGEPEYTFLELVNAINYGKKLDNVKGINYIKNGKNIRNPTRGIIRDLDSLPFPARHLLKRDLYFSPKLPRRPFTVVLTSRGCSHRCYYCVPSSGSFSRELEYRSITKDYTKPTVGLRSPDNVIEEFKLLKEEGYKSVSILDDQFVWGEKRTIDICNGIKNLDMEWGCLSRADHLNENIVKAMANAGCKYVDIGVESFNQNVLNYIKKDMRVETVFKAIKLLKKYGISVKLNILFGVSPLQTKEVIENDIRISKKIGADFVMYGITTPFPGTEFHDIALKNGWISTGDYVPTDPLRDSIIEYPTISSDELRRLLKKANRSFYLRPNIMIKSLLNIKNPYEIKKYVKSLWKLIT